MSGSKKAADYIDQHFEQHLGPPDTKVEVFEDPPKLIAIRQQNVLEVPRREIHRKYIPGKEVVEIVEETLSPGVSVLPSVVERIVEIPDKPAIEEELVPYYIPVIVSRRHVYICQRCAAIKGL